LDYDAFTLGYLQLQSPMASSHVRPNQATSFGHAKPWRKSLCCFISLQHTSPQNPFSNTD